MLNKIINKILSLLQSSKNKPSVDYSNWSNARPRLVPEVWPKIFPSFRINKADKVFTIGSCFARNIEEHLSAFGCIVPMLSFKAPKEEMGRTVRSNGILNKFSPASICQEIEWSEKIFLSGGKVTYPEIEKYLYACEGGRVLALHLGGYVPVSRERALLRRQEICDVFSQVFSSQLMVITLGLVESWWDSENELFIVRSPNDLMKNNVGRFKYVRLNYNKCLNYVEKTIMTVRKHKPDCKMLITTSPVPLKNTYAGQDVITANMYSKSVLRAVCGELADKMDNVDYFPSYETVVLTKNWSMYENNLRNVRDEVVRKIVGQLLESYAGDLDGGERTN